MSYSPWGCKESNRTEQLTLYYVGKRIVFKEIKDPPLSILLNSTFMCVLYTLPVHFNKLGKFRSHIYIFTLKMMIARLETHSPDLKLPPQPPKHISGAIRK